MSKATCLGLKGRIFNMEARGSAGVLYSGGVPEFLGEAYELFIRTVTKVFSREVVHRVFYKLKPS